MQSWSTRARALLLAKLRGQNWARLWGPRWCPVSLQAAGRSGAVLAQTPPNLERGQTVNERTVFSPCAQGLLFAIRAVSPFSPADAAEASIRGCCAQAGQAGMVHKWLKKGALVEVYADNEWWDANCILFNKNFVRVHYVGGVRHESPAQACHAAVYFEQVVPMHAARKLPLSAVLMFLLRRPLHGAPAAPPFWAALYPIPHPHPDLHAKLPVPSLYPHSRVVTCTSAQATRTRMSGWRWIQIAYVNTLVNAVVLCSCGRSLLVLHSLR